MAHLIHWKTPRFLVVRHYGTVTFKEQRKLLLTLPSDPRWDATKYYLSDWSDVERIDFTPEQLTEFAVHLSVHSYTLDRARLALVPGASPAFAATAHAFVDLMADGPIETSVQSDEVAAETWLKAPRRRPGPLPDVA